MADSLALPLVVEASGQLRRESQADAIVRLIGVMANTHSGFWPHAPWFGLLELFEESKTQVDELPRIGDAINSALQQLGVPGLTVAVHNAAGEYGARAFRITVREDGRPPVIRQVQV
jgi:hypothetical protein